MAGTSSSQEFPKSYVRLTSAVDGICCRDVCAFILLNELKSMWGSTGTCVVSGPLGPNRTGRMRGLLLGVSLETYPTYPYRTPLADMGSVICCVEADVPDPSLIGSIDGVGTTFRPQITECMFFAGLRGMGAHRGRVLGGICQQFARCTL